MRILVIEDEEAQREMVTMILETDGHEVCAIRDSEHLLDKIVKFRPDVIVTDIALPGVDGFGLIRIIHKNFPHIKILAYSAHATPAKFEEFHTNVIKLGANEFISKPYSIDLFMNKLRELL